MTVDLVERLLINDPPKHPNYRTYESRVNSFPREWNYSEKYPSIEKLATAGFYKFHKYSIPRSVRCFYCNCDIMVLDLTNQFAMHCKRNKECSYIKLMKGLQYIKYLRTLQPEDTVIEPEPSRFNEEVYKKLQ